MYQVKGVYREGNIEEERHRKIKANYITQKGWKLPVGLPLTPRGSNTYIIQTSADVSRQNEDIG